MTIWVVRSNYSQNGYFGVYSSALRARKAILYYFEHADDIIAFEEIDGYCYAFTTNKGEQFTIEILSDMVDWEFVEGMIKEDE